MANDNDTRARLFRALCGPEWSGADLAILAAMVDMGPPSSLHAGAPPAPTESAIGPGGVVEVWRTGRVDRVRAHVLAAYRDVGDAFGCPLPAPGKVAT